MNNNDHLYGGGEKQKEGRAFIIFLPNIIIIVLPKIIKTKEKIHRSFQEQIIFNLNISLQ